MQRKRNHNYEMKATKIVKRNDKWIVKIMILEVIFDYFLKGGKKSLCER